MTDKEKIRTEIVRLYEENKERHSVEGIAAVTEIRKLLSFIDSLPNEPTSEDLEKEIDRVYFKNECCSQRLHHKEIAEIARHFANWQKQQMIKDVVEATIIKTRVTNHTMAPTLSTVILSDAFHEGDKVKLIIVKED